MNYRIIFVAFLILMSFITQIKSQTKIVINDQVEFLNDNIDKILIERFQKYGLEYTFSVNTKTPCDYYYAVLTGDGENKYVSVENCKNEVLGKVKLISKSYFEDMDYAGMLFFKITDIIEQPFFYVEKEIVPVEEIVEEAVEVEEEIFEAEAVEEEAVPEIDPLENEHSSRYFFSPSSYNLKKGELYYNTVYFVLHDIQYGVSDNFSVGMGTSILGIPFYITPKYSLPINEMNRIAFGDMLIFGTWGTNFTANLAYATYTYGNPSNNLTVGLGFFSSNEGDMFNQKFNHPVLNLSAMAQLSPYIYFITENYFINYSESHIATYDDGYYDQTTWQWIEGTHYSKDFGLNTNLLMGFSGFRLINKSRDVISWQVGLTYFGKMRESMPNEYTGVHWSDDVYDGLNRLIIPSISYTQKFGKKY